jgi:hypothetical protein
MKICVINFSGNVGKSTIAKHLLAPRLEDCPVIAVESINTDEGSDEAIRGRRFRELSESLSLLDAAVVDVGASNVEDFLAGMAQLRGSHEDYDAFVLPVTPPKKQQRDTVSTIATLAEMGVEPDRIRVVLNLVEPDEDPHDLFGSLFAWQDEEKRFLKPRALIRTNELFGLLRGSERSISDLLSDETDYKAEIRKTTDANEKLRLSRALAMRRLALGVQEDLDAAWETLWQEAA